MARIAGSVYSDINPAEFYVDQYGNPSPMMMDSVLWRLHHHRLEPQKLRKGPKGEPTKLEYFEEVYTTKNRMIRIYKILKVDETSKKHPFGTYPPKIQKVRAKAKDFSEVKRVARLKAGKFD